MQTMMVKSGARYRKATAAEVAEVAGFYASQELNREKPVLANPTQAVSHLTRIFAGRDYESFGLLMLDTRGQLIQFVELFRGSINVSAVHPREVVKECLWRGAASVILTHNHPSGLADPSAADERITTRLRDALALIEVPVLDHLIIGGTGSWFSMQEHGLI